MIAGLGLGYLAAFVVLHPRIGDGVVALTTIPVVAAGWAYGAVGGALAGLAGVALNITLMQTIGHQDGFRPSQLPRIVVLIALGTLTGWIRDLYRRQRALIEANRAEANLREMIERSRDAIWVVRDDVIAFANPAVALLVGATGPSALVGRDPLTALIHPDDRDALRARMAEASGPTTAAPLEVHLQHADGSLRVVETELFPVEHDGRPSLMTVGRDVTARKELEARAAAADRMAVLGTLTAGIGHEINNPLSVIAGNLAYIDRAVGARDAELAEAIRDARAAATRAGEIVKHMRVFVQTTASTAPADVARVVESTVRIIANEVRHRGVLALDVEPTPPIALPDAQLGQILINLVVNANQALPARRPEDNRITIRTRTVAAGSRVRLEVIDNGAGIPAEVRHRIFEPFFTTKPIGLGTGLGLWVCHQLVTAAGGTIEVESAPGEGTTVRVEFPVIAPPAPRVATAPVAAPGAPRARVLVIDDDPLVGRAMNRLLAPLHDLEVMQDGRDAIDAICAGRRFDVILCDLMMPEMSGMEVFARLAAVAPDQADRTIFMTGGAFTAEATAFMANPARVTLEKPFQHDAVRAAIADVLARAPAREPCQATSTPESAPP